MDTNIARIRRNIFDRIENLESLSIVWLVEDQTATSIINIIANMRNIIDYIKIFDDCKAAEKYIRKVVNEQIFLILSVNYDFISTIEDCEQIHSIYIYTNRDRYIDQRLKVNNNGSFV